MPQTGPNAGDFFAVGIYGQYIYVNPSANLVIAKNAADREFLFTQSNRQHSTNMNVDMFRSLADQLRPIDLEWQDELGFVKCLQDFMKDADIKVKLGIE